MGQVDWRTPLRVLHIEDEPVEAQFVDLLLGAETGPYDVHSVSTLRDALAARDDMDPDVILLDLCLPDGQRSDTLDAVVEHFPGVPIVVLTGLEDLRTAVDSLHRGAVDFLAKSDLDRTALERALRRAVRSTVSEKERRRGRVP